MYLENQASIRKPIPCFPPAIKLLQASKHFFFCPPNKDTLKIAEGIGGARLDAAEKEGEIMIRGYQIQSPAQKDTSWPRHSPRYWW